MDWAISQKQDKEIVHYLIEIQLRQLQKVIQRNLIQTGH